MSTSFDVALVPKYNDDILELARQNGNRLMPTVSVEPDVVGEKVFFNRIGESSFRKVTTRHGDSPLTEQEHSVRMATIDTYDNGNVIDRKDRVMSLIGPDGAYTKGQADAINKGVDLEIIAAASRPAATGKDGSGTASLTAANQVAASFATTVTLTVEKLIEAKRILDDFETPDEGRVFVTNAKGFSDLLNITKVTSADFNSVRALVHGEIDTFLGFKFIRSGFLSVASNIRTNLAYQKDAIKFAQPMQLEAMVDPARSDKRFSTYIMLEAAFGAVRMEEKRVVEVFTDES